MRWVITAYALTFGGFLLLGGRAADLFGRRLTLTIGMTCFTLCSLAIGFSNSEGMLIGLRAAQGLAAALMSPSALSIVLATFPEGRNRGRALGFWSTIATGGAAVGLLLGGALTQLLSWQWDFFINVPVGIIMVPTILAIVPGHESTADHKHLDLPGAALSTLGLMSLVYAFSQAPYAGWLSTQTLGVAALSAVLLALFVWNESRSAHPLVPLTIFTTGNVAGANIFMTCLYACLLGLFFIATLYMQTILHFSPLETGLAFLPFPLVIAFFSILVPGWVQRFGYKRFLLIGPCFVAAGLLWLARLPLAGNYFIDLLPALLLMPVGVGMNFMPIVAAATAGIPEHEGGLASGMITTSQQMGGALGLSILSGIASSASLGSNAAVQVAGFDNAFLASVAFTVLGFLTAVFFIKEREGDVRSTSVIAVH